MHHAHPVNPPTAAHKHRSVIPRILQRKGGEPPSIDTTHSFKGSPGRKSHSKSEVSLHHPPSTSPSHSTQRFASVSSATKPDAPTNSTNRSTFDDDDLNTAKDIRSAIMILETEGRRLIDAFDDLEERTAARIKQQTARRLPANTPENLTVLIDGSDWRERRPPLLPDPPKSPRRIRRYPSDSIDRSSIRSGSSIGTTLSQSRSVASLSQASKPGSPLSSRFPHRPISIRRKNSVSSLGVTTSSLSRSTGHLPLSMLAEHEGMQSSDTLPMPKSELDEDAEIVDIRKRRAEVVARYGTRLEYLKARLKGAELHEKLLRK
ncbi:hypothetical protein BD779DRAFT_587031 [Infundibulicybe gibba]|nr:hypothetical protein BD779DRAFT_587031 [Infundibulicybe gibba]